MGQVIVRNLNDSVIETLKARAGKQGRSLEAELRVILEKAASERSYDHAEFLKKAERIRNLLADRPHTDSAEMIREDRNR